MLGDPAMRRWLDGLNSTKTHPNENLGREFLELFALGEGNFTERDVREVARALTGWNEIDHLRQHDEFDPAEFDDGTKTILGETGPWGLDDLPRIACRQPAAAVHVARRLYRTFIADTTRPPDALLAPLADAIRVKDDVDVSRGIELILRSRLFHSPECRGRRVKSPVDYAIGIIRACELFDPPPELVDLEIHLTRMGQRLFFPPSVAGWPSGVAWLGGQELVARANFAAWVTGSALPAGAGHFEALARRHGLESSKSCLDSLAVLLFGAPVAQAHRTRTGPEATDLPESVRTLISRPEAQLA